MPKRAVAYVRADGAASDSPPNPDDLRVVREYAREHGHTVVKMISDSDPSVLDLRRGSPMAKVLESLHSNDADALLVVSVGSLPGDFLDQEVLLAHLTEHGFVLLTADGMSNLNSEDRALLRQFVARSLSNRSRLLAIRLGVARRRAKIARGRREGAKAYGTLSGEGPILERIGQLFSDGVGYAPIANTFNAEGIKPRRGEKWYPTTIANILGARQRLEEHKRTGKRHS